jgi:hypothetical protein
MPLRPPRVAKNLDHVDSGFTLKNALRDGAPHGSKFFAFWLLVYPSTLD